MSLNHIYQGAPNPIPIQATTVTIGNATITAASTTADAYTLPAGGGQLVITTPSSATDGQVPIGVTGGEPVNNTITPGLGMAVINSPGNITIGLTTSGSAYTPALQFGGVSTGITYASNQGRYATFGSCVFFQILFQLSSKGTITGSAGITLPFFATANMTFSITRHQAMADSGGGNYTLFSAAGRNIASVSLVNTVGAILTCDDTYFTDNTVLGVNGMCWVT